MGNKSQKQISYQIDLDDANAIKEGPFIMANGVVCVPMLVRAGVFLDQCPQWLEGKITWEQYKEYIDKINDNVQEESLKINRDFLKNKPHPMSTERRLLKLQARLKHNKHNLLSSINALLMDINKTQEGVLEFRCCGADPRGRMSALRIDQYLEYVASVFLLIEVVDATQPSRLPRALVGSSYKASIIDENLAASAAEHIHMEERPSESVDSELSLTAIQSAQAGEFLKVVEEDRDAEEVVLAESGSKLDQTSEQVAAEVVEFAIARALTECIGFGLAAPKVDSADAACMTDWSFLADSAQQAKQSHVLMLDDVILERDVTRDLLGPSIIKVSHGRLSLPLQSEMMVLQNPMRNSLISQVPASTKPAPHNISIEFSSKGVDDLRAMFEERVTDEERQACVEWNFLRLSNQGVYRTWSTPVVWSHDSRKL